MISIIIPAHNEGKYIKKCLDSIKGDDYEVITVCDSCTDRTEKIAKKYGRVYNVKYMNVSKARNYGAKKAKGDVLLFLDADCVVSKNLLKEVHRSVMNGYIGGVTKTYSIEDYYKSKLMWAIGNIGRYFFITASGMFFCRKDMFTSYDEKKKVAEDTFLILDLKKKGKLKYITNSFIKTSSRRFEKKGYLKTILWMYSGFFRAYLR